MADALKALWALTLPVWLALPLSASALTDPTQPPAAVRTAASRPGAAPAEAAAPPMRLQGLRSGGQTALIDGQLRRVGEQWQGHTLLRIDTQAVWLRDPAGQLLRLSLLPAKHPPVESRP